MRRGLAAALLALPLLAGLAFEAGAQTPVALTISPAALTVIEGDDTHAVLTLRLSAARATATAFTVVTIGTGASENSDFVPGPFTVTIDAGKTEATLRIEILDDNFDVNDDDETFNVLINAVSLPTGVTAGTPSQATVTITDDDAPPPAPAGLTAEAGDGRVVLAWTYAPPEVDRTSGFEYRAQAGTAAWGAWTAVPGGAGRRGHRVTGLANGTEHTFEVRARTRNGVTGPASAQAAATPDSEASILAAEVRTWLSESSCDTACRGGWRRALKALGGTGADLDAVTPLTHREALALAVTDSARSGRWGRVAAVLLDLEADRTRVSIAALTAGPVAEGAVLRFRLTADAAPAAALAVGVKVEDVQASPGAQRTSDFVADVVREVTIPAGQTSAEFTVATVDDGAEEPGGFVNATLEGSLDYAPGDRWGASAQVLDNDTPGAVERPVATVSGGAGVTEGAGAVFTLTVAPPPSTSLAVSVNITQTGDFAASGQTGARTVTVGSGGTATFTVATEDDGAYEADGAVRATLTAGVGYARGTPASASVAVADNDPAPTDTGAPTATLTGVPEKINSTTAFTATVTFNEAVTGFVKNDVTVTGGTAGTFTAASTTVYTLSVTPTSGSSVTVTVMADSATDGSSNTGPAAAVSRTAVWDATAPTLSIGVPAAINSLTAFTATFTFSEAVTGFAADDVTVTGGAKGGLSGSGASYAMPVTPATTGTDVTVRVRANAAGDGINSGPASAVTATAAWDADAPGVATAQPSDRAVAEGDASDTATFTVALATQPSGAVTVTVAAPPGLELDGPDGATAFTASEALSFTTGSWSTAQTVTVRATDNSADDPFGRTLSVDYGTSSSDSAYSGLTGTAATVTVADDDATPVTLAGGAGNVEEGRAKTFTVTLGRALVSGEALPVRLTFGGGATRGTDYGTACASADGLSCNDLNAAAAPTVTFTGPSARSARLTLRALADGDAEPGGETVAIGLGALNASSGTNLGGGASGIDRLADFRIIDAPTPPPTQPPVNPPPTQPPLNSTPGGGGTGGGGGSDSGGQRPEVAVGAAEAAWRLPPASDPFLQGFVRVVNHSGRAGEVTVTATDDAGREYGPLALRLEAHAAVHFNSTDLEEGNAAKGLPEGTGPGTGSWRLTFGSDALDVEALGLLRTADGFVTAMRAVAPRGADGALRLLTFNPASNFNQVSRLRLVNPTDAEARATVTGTDDAGASPGSPVVLTLPAGSACEVDAAALESGRGLACGAPQAGLGDGTGKWRLSVASEAPLVAMGLLSSPGGHLTNLSGTLPADADGVRCAAFLPPASDPHGRQGFVRVANLSGRAGTVAIRAFDDSDARYEPLALRLGAGEAAQFNSDDLELGNARKGLTGSTGSGTGAWRLELSGAGIEFEAGAYVRHADGFLTAVQAVAPSVDGVHRVATFNPGSNTRQVSVLRLVNRGSRDATASVTGADDGGVRGGPVEVRVPAGSAVELTAAQLESGEAGAIASGALGDGRGKWRLRVASEGELAVMGLVSSVMGRLANWSGADAARGVPPLPSLLPPPASVAAEDAGGRRVRGEWDAVAGARYAVDLLLDGAPVEGRSLSRTTRTSFRWSGLAPGAYALRVRSVDADGLAGPWSPATDEVVID